MKRNLMEIYALAVCFFTLACFVVVLGIAIWEGISVVSPEFTIDGYIWERHVSDESFKEHLIAANDCDDEADKTYAPPEGAALTLARNQSFSQTLRAERREGVQGLAQNAIVLLIDVVLFAIHWRLAARARMNAS